MAVAGLAGMVLETLLILHYQLKSGILYQDIGILLMGFMAGLALGALAVDKMAGSERNEVSAWWGAALMAGFALLAITTLWIVRTGVGTGLLEVSSLLVLAGFLVAGVFAFASLRGIHDQAEMISPLYAADLFGGCVGSLAASLVLVPVMGLDGTAGLAVPLVLVSVLLL